jgi:hypothetical protein
MVAPSTTGVDEQLRILEQQTLSKQNHHQHHHHPQRRRRSRRRETQNQPLSSSSPTNTTATDTDTDTATATSTYYHQPGAYSVPGRAFGSTAPPPPPTTTTTVGNYRGLINHHDQQQQQHAAAAAAATTTRRQNVDQHNTVVAAFLVENDHYHSHQSNQELTQREREVMEQEIRLAEQAEKLRVWEEELEHKKRELESYSQRDIVQAEIIVATAAIPHDTPKQQQHQQKQHRRSFVVNLHLPKFASRTYNHNSADGDDSDDDQHSIPSSAHVNHHQQPQDEMRSDNLDLHLVELAIGEGPLRFANRGERSLDQQIQDLSRSDRICYKNLLQRWDDRRTKMNTGTYHLPKEACLRFARNNTKKDGFCEERAWKWMRKFNKRYLCLSAHGLEEQLLSKTLFPVPGLMTKAGHEMFYMKPARYFPKETSTQSIIDNLAYVMNTMLERERPCTEGVGFLANMDTWAMKNFDVNYCYNFMMTLQGFVVPVRVQLFLIVNPPSWFGVIWKIMKGMLAPSFRRKVKMIGQDKLAKYLEEGFETYLPDDMEMGQADTTGLVEDFVTLRKYLETKPTSVPNDGRNSDHVSTSHQSDRVSMDHGSDTRSRSCWSASGNNPSGTHGSSHPSSETDSVISLDHELEQLLDDEASIDGDEASIDGDLSFDTEMACDDFGDDIAEVQIRTTACTSDLSILSIEP